MNDKQSSFIKFLRDAYQVRYQKNMSYSLRAFALSLKISPATLSGVLSGQRPLTPRMIKRICEGMELNPVRVRSFIQDSVASNILNPKELKSPLVLEDDEFQLISEWYHFAILRLIRLPHFKPSERWIAQYLALPVIQVREAVERLERIGLLEKKGDKWIDRSGGNTSYLIKKYTNTPAKKFQLKMLEKSAHALEEVPAEIRDHSGVMMTISEKGIAQAKELIATFRRSLTEILEEDSDLKHVYYLGISFFPLSKTTNKNN